MTKTLLLIDPVLAIVRDAALFPDEASIVDGAAAVQLGEGLFPAAEGCFWHDGPGAIGWSWDGTAANPPDAVAIDLVAYAADRRWQREVGGITVSAIPIATDDRSKLMIAGARLAAMADPEWTTPWHGADGGIYPLDAAAIVAISDAVSAHVQATFTAFATVKAAIASGTITTTAEIDAAFQTAA